MTWVSLVGTEHRNPNGVARPEPKTSSRSFPDASQARSRLSPLSEPDKPSRRAGVLTTWTISRPGVRSSGVRIQPGWPLGLAASNA